MFDVRVEIHCVALIHVGVICCIKEPLYTFKFCRALRTALDDRLNIDQTMALLQGTAGLYQDLRTELRNRMETFEKYALAEILRVPPGLLQSAAASTIGRGDASINEEDLKRREEAVDDRIESLRKEIAATKRRTRDMNVTVMELDRLLQENQSQLASLQAVPNVLASTTDTNKEIQTIVHKGLEIEKKYSELDAIRKAQVDTGSEAIDDTFPADRMAMAITTVNVEEDMPDSAVEKEILRRQAASKIAPAEDLRKLRQNLGL